MSLVADYYVDSAGSNTSPYDTWTKAANQPQTIADLTPAAGTIIGIRGTVTLTDKLDVGSLAGSDADGFIQWIGCNSSGEDDGTLAILDANSAVANCIYLNSTVYNIFKNLDVKNATGAGIDNGASSTRNVFYNVHAHNNAGDGFETYDISRGLFYRCSAYSNSGSGFDTQTHANFVFCSAHNNSGDGFDGIYNNAGSYWGCIAYKNGAIGFNHIISPMYGCTSHANTGDQVSWYGTSNYYLSFAIGSRITGALTGKYGSNYNSRAAILIHSYLDQAAGIDLLDDDNVLKFGNQFNGTDTDYGYNYPDNDDYNLTATATMRDIEITLPE